MPFQIDGRGDMNAFVLTSPLAGVMLLTRRQPFYPSAAHDKFFSICTAFGGYTKFGIAPDKLSVLCNPYIQPGKGSQLVGGVKAVDVSNFAQNNDPKDVQDARNLAIP